MKTTILTEHLIFVNHLGQTDCKLDKTHTFGRKVGQQVTAVCLNWRRLSNISTFLRINFYLSRTNEPYEIANCGRPRNVSTNIK